MSKIDLIIKDKIMDEHYKQVGIEKVVLEYDLDWFKKELKNYIGNRYVILYDIYKNFDVSLKYITQPYLKNYWFKFKKIVSELSIGTTDSNTKNYNELKSIIIFLLLGNDSIISTSLKSVVELISKYEDEMKANRTEMLFSTANRLIKFDIYNLKVFNEMLIPD